MFRRLALALLILCLALPATAMSAMAGPSPCHDTDMVMAGMDMTDMAGHHEQERKAAPAAPASHDCIGCIAPYTGAPAAFTARLVAALPPMAPIMPPISGAERLPETPPPRT